MSRGKSADPLRKLRRPNFSKVNAKLDDLRKGVPFGPDGVKVSENLSTIAGLVHDALQAITGEELTGFDATVGFGLLVWVTNPETGKQDLQYISTGERETFAVALRELLAHWDAGKAAPPKHAN